MKILTYNIHNSTQTKINKVLEYDADIYILPEISCPSLVSLPEGYQMEWMGESEKKGLGVIWKPNVQAEVPDWFNSKHQYFLPLLIEGKLIIAAWPTTTNKNKPKPYPRIAMEALQEYACHLRDYPTLISGDMNCYKGQSGENKQYSIQSIFTFLESMGIVSAYHTKSGESIGAETTATYYHQFKRDKPFFIDYTFTNIPLKSYQLGEWDSSLSDHVCQRIEI